MSKKVGWSAERQAESDEYSRQLLSEYRAEGVPMRVLAKRHGEHISAIGRRMQRARDMERGQHE